MAKERVEGVLVWHVDGEALGVAGTIATLGILLGDGVWRRTSILTSTYPYTVLEDSQGSLQCLYMLYTRTRCLDTLLVRATASLSLPPSAVSSLTFGLGGEGHVVVDSLSPRHRHDGHRVVVPSLVTVEVS